MARVYFVVGSGLILAVLGVLGLFWPWIWMLYWVVVPVIGVGVYDMLQTSHAICRNFPVIGHLRFLMEAIRPEMQQYFIESDTDGRPFSREQRSVVYQRAKGVLDTQPFGTRHDVYGIGAEWVEHSLAPLEPPETPPRMTIGTGRCSKPYAAALLNISAMSYGSLSKAAILALNGAAKDGGFYHNTGEGGLSPYHLEPGGDVVWQIGTGYFGCRELDGTFSAPAFQERARLDNVKMIEIKLSQGAKPGHGGILPAGKVTREIAEIRRVPMGQDVLSPPAHSAFSGPTGLLEFVAQLREASGGKPVGFKLCLGRRRDFLAICKAMVETGLLPDFITVDGSEGGTGAAPLEFSNAVGWPLYDGLTYVHSALRGVDVRDKVRVITSGRVVDGFDMFTRIALGGDLCNSARGMMFALGCIQALRCNNNSCPTGVATQDPRLVAGLVIADKRPRVAAFQRATVRHFLELMSASGCREIDDLVPEMVFRRVGSTESQTLAELYPFLARGALLEPRVPEPFRTDWASARVDRF